MFVFVKAINAAGRFFRAGLEFTAEGRVIDFSKLTESVRAALEAEPNIHLREANEMELVGLDPVAADEGVKGPLHDELMQLIPVLPFEAFGQDGPKVGEVRKAMSDADPKSITKEAVQAAFNDLTEAGFKAPAPADT